MEEPVTIVDREVLKVLAVDTRMDILKELSQGNRTPSDLGKKLEKSGATIIEHLEKLEKAGLVKKIEQPGKKWVFYTLTDKGYGIVSNKSNRLVIVLGLSVLVLVGSFFGLFYTYVLSGALQASSIAEKTLYPDVIVRPTPVNYWPEILFVVALAGFIFYFIIRRVNKGS